MNKPKIYEELDEKVEVNADNFSAEGKALLAGLGMPSSRFESLTIAASGSTYTMPANGWLYFGINASAANAAISLSCKGLVVTQIAPASGGQLRQVIPVCAGDEVVLGYSNSSAAILRFIYAEGAE